MKKSKILVLILALTLIFGMMAPLFAKADEPDAKIVIKCPSGHSFAGQDFYAFKIFDVKFNENGTYEYKIASDFAAFDDYPDSADKTLLEYLQGLQKGADEDPDLANDKLFNSPAMTDLATALWSYIDGVVDYAGTAAGTGTADVTIDGLEPGYYLVYSTSTVPGLTGDVTIVAACALLTTTESKDVFPKVDVPEIDKEVWNHNPTAKWDKWTDVNIGDEVQFRHTTAVPQMIAYESYTFIVHDTMSKGLTFDPDSLAITIGGADYENSEGLTDKYALTYEPIVTGSAPDEEVVGTKITIEFKNFISLKAQAGETILITYSAMLNQDAVIGKPGNPNKVYLEYSRDPYWDGDGDEDTGKTPEDEVVVYTFEMDIFKYTGDLEEGKEYTALEGAEFELRLSDEEDADGIEFIDLGNGVYRVATPAEKALQAAAESEPDYDPETDAVTTVTLVSASDGTIKIRGLDARTYYLVETKAPENYNLIPGWITVIVVHEPETTGPDAGEKKGAQSLTVIDEEATLEKQPCVNVQNNLGTELPGTGGIGTTIFYIVGAILATLLTAAFIISRRRRILNVE